ncbi:WD40-repeat-containing domain protein [Kockovaella imperatae]|uniref:WD40-repeat-containing domain protein n=1 Tax=Kockovaella imperatae TaxID=4999 RepID=A0A1Y1UQG0_9TREE|nr:WD40-repeat-containing domain protein [Kockovaella imperatae]ORX39375.1 WD40-repeat-containing domain protein [Kockovaella imperatae]
MSAQPGKPVPVETQHEDMIHDAQLDYYGKRLATCSSDKTIRIFNVIKGEAQGEPVILKGHTAPVWQLAWAHPSFGSILASCSYDGRVFIWKEVGAGGGKGSGGELQDGWERIKEHTLHTASVNSIAWAPYDLGPILACASSDGKISILSFQNDGSTDASIFPAHGQSANAVSWAPSVLSTPPGQAPQPGQNGQVPGVAAGATLQQQKRIVSGGSDNLIRIWGYDEQAKKWIEEEVIQGHDDWVRDVAWAPNIGLPGMYIASASQDKTVLIHSRPSPSASWTSTALLPNAPESKDPHFADAVWRTSWSLAGNILAVSCGDGKVSLWKEGVGRGWECVSDFSS